MSRFDGRRDEFQRTRQILRPGFTVKVKAQLCAPWQAQARDCNGQKVNNCSKNAGKPRDSSMPPMGSSPSQQKIYRAAVAGIPRVVQAISELPSKHHAEALAAAGRGYRQTIVDSGIAEPTADRMVATLLRRLQSRLAKERSVKNKVMRALQEELIPPEPAAARKPRRRSPKRPPRTVSPPIQDEAESDVAPVKKSPTTSPE
jgi:hypothetical protein